MGSEQRSFYRFGPFRLYAPELLLLCNGQPLRLTPKALQTLLVLVRNQGGMVTRDELFQAVWPDTFIDESILAHNVCEIRKALAVDGGRGELYIETVPKRGYRFVPEVEFEDKKPAVKSLAVLPFKAVGLAECDEYLGFGLADAVTARLAEISGLALRPSSTVARYAAGENDSVKVGSVLAVTNVLEGVLRNIDGKLRLSVQLVDVNTRNTMWATTCDGSATELLRMEDEVTERIATALPVNLKDREWSRVRRRHTGDLKAYRLHLQARALFFRHPATDALRESMALLEQALRRDPNFALCYSSLAFCYQFLAMFDAAPPAEVIPPAVRAAEKALQLDSGLVEAQAALAFARWHYDFEWTGAESLLRQLAKLAPNDSRVHFQLAMLIGETGRFRESLDELEKALELEPNFAIVHASKALVLCWARRFDEALAAARTALRLDAECFRAHWILGIIQSQRGKYSQAIQHLRRAAEMSGNSPAAMASLLQAFAASGSRKAALGVLDQLRTMARGRYVSASEMAVAYAGLGEIDRAFDSLSAAVEERSVSLVLAKVDPQLDPLRPDPRFDQVLRRIGLAG